MITYTAVFNLNTPLNKIDIFKTLIILRYKKLESHIHLKDTHIVVNKQRIIIESEKEKTVIPFSNAYTLTLNRVYVGFKPNLSTKLSGSLFLNTLYNRYKITFPVGFSPIKLKRI